MDFIKYSRKCAITVNVNTLLDAFYKLNKNQPEVNSISF